MKHINKKTISIVLLLVALAISTVGVVFASKPAVPLFGTPSGFTSGLYFTLNSSNNTRIGVCWNSESPASSTKRSSVKCSLRNSFGTSISYSETTGSFGQSYIEARVNDITGNSRRVVLFSTHEFWWNGGNNYDVDYKMI